MQSTWLGRTSITRMTIVHSKRRNIAKMVATSFLSDQAVRRFLRQFQLGQRFACFQSFVSNQGQCGLRRKGPPVHKARFNFDPSEPTLHANDRFVALHYVACTLSQAQAWTSVVFGHFILPQIRHNLACEAWMWLPSTIFFNCGSKWTVKQSPYSLSKDLHIIWL
jgi:hypothetical protein